MDLDALHDLIAQKLADRQLPHETCERLIDSGQFVVRGGAMHFHIDCLYLWDVARQALAGVAGPEHAARP